MKLRVLILVVAKSLVISATVWAEATLLGAALESITGDELYQHVEILADDVYEGRALGSRGGRAAARYVVKQLEQYELTPAGTDDDFVHAFDRGGRNILALRPGNDPRLEQEVILVGAHYDHVGDGTKGSSFGPVGPVHNGADDNASGISVLLEVIEALSVTGLGTRRSILFVFWDGEEQGLLGSKAWVRQPTVPLERIKLKINIDMVGRLRDGRLQVLGTRSGYGLRRLMSGPVSEPLWLDFSWELAANGDHWPFLERQIPTAMLHTGLHEDYHRPTDDVRRINHDGMRQVSRYLLSVLVKAANADELPAYRAGVKGEQSVSRQRAAERPLAALSLDNWPPQMPPPRLGISWRDDAAEPSSIYLTRVIAGTPAAEAGLAVHDRILEVNGQHFADGDAFRQVVTELLDAQAAEMTLLVESRGRVRTVTIAMPSSLPAAP